MLLFSLKLNYPNNASNCIHASTYINNIYLYSCKLETTQTVYNARLQTSFRLEGFKKSKCHVATFGACFMK